jgi:NAD(P)-dependent dehydrogenase (short-subunit alcohol dehydrogenase family)
MYDQAVALITGANQGIGLQVATELAARGFIALLGSRDASRGEAAAKAIGDRAVALQLDVTDAGSIAAAAEQIGRDFGRLDLLIQNAAISNVDRRPDESVEAHARRTRPSNVSIADMRTVWDTNVFGVLAIYQAMLPLLRRTPGSRIVHVSSGAGLLARNSDPSNEHRALFGPIYPASKTALNALTLAMAIELEPEGIPVNAVSPGFVRTNLNGFAGTETLEYGAREILRVALLGTDGPTATFTRWCGEVIPW